MRIKYITNVRIPTPRAQGYAIMKMCNEFARIGVEIKLFVPERQGGDLKQDPFEFYEIEKNFEINKIPGSDLLAKTHKFGRLFYWIDVLTFFIMVKSRVGPNKEDILYTRDYLTLLFFPRHNYSVFEVHDIPNSKFLFKHAIKKVKIFFVLNNNLKKELITLGIPDNKIFISPSGVDIANFNIDITKEEARDKIDLPKDKHLAMYTGHLYEWKGADTLAEAAILMPEVLFVFVGGVEPELTKFKNKYGNNKNIIIRSFVERSFIPFYLKSADVLVLPNSKAEKISSKYTSPLKLFEYMASKRPIVASDLPSIREVLNENNCFFAQPDDPASFVRAIKSALRDASQAILDQAFADVYAYTWRQKAENILKTIQRLV